MAEDEEVEDLGLGDIKGITNVVIKLLSFVLIAIAIIVGLYLLIKFYPNVGDKTGIISETTSIANWLNELRVGNTFAKYVGGIISYTLKLVFGIRNEYQLKDSAIITLICVWFVFFLVLKDLINLFGMFSKNTSTWIGIFVAIIIANLGFFGWILYTLMDIFAFLAGFAVIAVLLSIFVVAFGAHFGINNWGLWIMKRKAMLKAAKIEGEGKKLSETVGALLDVGKKFQEKAE
ncbi:MAG: hypothetical protein ABIG37_00850 [Nanoarchaeota archaeon]